MYVVCVIIHVHVIETFKPTVQLTDNLTSLAHDSQISYDYLQLYMLVLTSLQRVLACALNYLHAHTPFCVTLSALF